MKIDRVSIVWILCSIVLLTDCLFPSTLVAADSEQAGTIELRCELVPHVGDFGAIAEAQRRIVFAFRAHHPNIQPVTTEGLRLNQSTGGDMLTFMQIAGDIAPDVMSVNFHQSDTYITDKLLFPLDNYVERAAGADIKDGASLSTEDYITQIKMGRQWNQIENRIPLQCWPVMRRECPYGEQCPYRQADGLAPLARHYHIWSFPVGPLVMGLRFNKEIFAEHRKDGVEMRVPHDWEEMLKWAKIMTHPEAQEYGLDMGAAFPAWYFLDLLYSAGGEAVKQNPDGSWRCVLGTEEAARAAYFYARLRLEPVVRNGKTFRGVTIAARTRLSDPTRYAMQFNYLDQRFLDDGIAGAWGFGPVPKGPTGLQRGEFNALMCGIFSGLAKDPARRDAAWEYLYFYDSDEARRIRTETMVEAGLGRFVRPFLLKQFNVDGRYDDVLRQVSPEIEQTYQIAYAGGVPEPYGKNCKYIYEELNKPLGEIWQSLEVREAVDAHDEERGLRAIRPILARAEESVNIKMLGNLPPAMQQTRRQTAWFVIAIVSIIFVFMFGWVLKTFRTPAAQQHARAETSGSWQFYRYRTAYLLMAPALLTIALWAYWPLARGTLIAFQNYSVLGDSAWVGSGNFAEILYDPEFWHSIRISILYALLFILFGFWTPIALALLLNEVPRGKVLLRTVYYLPALLSGVVVILLWRSFYAPQGLVNHLFAMPIALLNRLNLVSIDPAQNWLDNPHAALFCCLLPVIWAGLGPGSLIYLAALKTIPDELYEAADIDGAGIRHKIFSVALPSIRALVIINFIGAIIAAVRDAGGFILAMTGGGPYSTQGGVTEVTSLKIFFTTFGYLKFGPAAAMAWVLGAMLIGFTVLQLQKLSRLEFRTAQKT